MRNVKVVISCVMEANNETNVAFARAERVARFGTTKDKLDAYEPFLDEDIEVYYKLINWKDNSLLPSYYIDIETLRRVLNAINLQIK